MRVLTVAAVREELGPLDGEVLGMGAVGAGVRSASLLAERRPEHVVLVGTCGAYAGGPPLGTAVASRRLGLSWGVAALGLGYVPLAPSPLQADPDLLGALEAGGCAPVDVLTVGAITTDRALAARLGDGWGVEHLEAFAVATACQQAGVPFVAVLGVANEVGPKAHQQWLTHRDKALQVAQQAAAPLLA